MINALSGGQARTLQVARIVVRVTFVVQLLLGIGLWTGRLDQVRPLHIAIGVLFVLGLWTVAAVAFAAGGNRALAAVIVLWGVVLAVFGLTQEGILDGGWHWTIQVLHLAVAMAGIGMAEALARPLAANPIAEGADPAQSG